MSSKGVVVGEYKMRNKKMQEILKIRRNSTANILGVDDVSMYIYIYFGGGGNYGVWIENKLKYYQTMHSWGMHCPIHYGILINLYLFIKLMKFN